MTASILVHRPKEQPGSPPVRGSPEVVWAILRLAGFALAVVGLFDLGLTWIPLRFGVREWEFGTVTASLNALPVVTMGLALLLGGAIPVGKRLVARGVAVLLLGLAFCIVAAALLYATNLPFIFEAAREPALAEGVRKSVLKTGMQVALFPTVYVLLAIHGWRHSGRRR
jgi:hypothetical protein